MTDTTPTRLSFIERQKEHAFRQAAEREQERRQVARALLGANRSRRRVDEVINLEGDYIVKVVDGDEVMWTAVVDGKPSRWYHRRQEEAILHLIAIRYDANADSSQQAAFYAGRVLGIPDSDN